MASLAGLVRLDDGTVEGYIRLCNTDFALSVTAGQSPTIRGCGRLRAALAPHLDRLQRQLKLTSLEQWLRELTELLERQLQETPRKMLPPRAFYDLVIRELDAIG